MANKFYNKFKSLTTTSNIDEEKKKRVKALSTQSDTSFKELDGVLKGTVADTEMDYLMKLIKGRK